MDEKCFKFCDRQLNPIISVPEGTISKYGTGEERLADVANCFEEFAKLIKNLKDLPIQIVNIQGISSAFRLTDVFAPLPCNFNYSETIKNSFQIKMDQKYIPKYPFGKIMPPYVKPLEILLQLGIVYCYLYKWLY